MAPLILPTLDETTQRYLRDVKLRQPEALTGRGTQPYFDAVTFAGQTPALYKDLSIASERALISRTFGTELDDYGNDQQKPRQLGSGSFGTVAAETGATGATYTNGLTLKAKDTGEAFVFDGATGVYTNGAPLIVRSVGLGRQTNLAPGAVLLWDSPPAGSLPSVKVLAGANGKGLVGGADVEEDPDYQVRLQGYLADPPADGNEGHYLLLVEEGDHGVPVKQAYLYPSILGTGTMGVTFIVRDTLDAKLPTPAQLAAVETFLRSGVLPFGDNIFMIALGDDPTSPAQKPILGIKFVPGQTGFLDPDPFPRRDQPAGVPSWQVGNVVAPTALAFDLVNTVGYPGSGIRVGQTVALWNGQKFVPKRIGSFTGTGPFRIFVDDSADSSDTTYVPVAGQYVCPWSDKLEEVAQLVVDYYDTLGPGENTTLLPDPGDRMRRYPPDSVDYPMGVTGRLTGPILARPDVQSVVVHAGLVAAPTPGTPGVNSRAFILEDLAFYPLS
jgi:uncharacterized phage protein gp47/JayE